MPCVHMRSTIFQPSRRAAPFEILVAARRWDDPLDLLKLVESVAIEAGMTRAYADENTNDVEQMIRLKEGEDKGFK